MFPVWEEDGFPEVGVDADYRDINDAETNSMLCEEEFIDLMLNDGTPKYKMTEHIYNPCPELN